MIPIKINLGPVASRLLAIRTRPANPGVGTSSGMRCPAMDTNGGRGGKGDPQWQHFPPRNDALNHVLYEYIVNLANLK